MIFLALAYVEIHTWGPGGGGESLAMYGLMLS